MQLNFKSPYKDHQSQISVRKKEWVEFILRKLHIDLSKQEVGHVIFQKHLEANKIEILDFPAMDAVRILKDEQIIAEWGGADIDFAVENEGIMATIKIETISIFDDG